MIKLTKTIAGRTVELDVISLDGNATVRAKCFRRLSKGGITRSDLEKAGFGIESPEKTPEEG